MKIASLSGLLHLAFSATLMAQDTPGQVPGDSNQVGVVQQAVELLHEADSIRMADSINREVLRKQLDELRSTETARREQLEKELGLLIARDSLRKFQLRREIDSLRITARGYPVIGHRDTLFMVYAKIGSITAAERAKVINERLQELYRSFLPKKDSLTIIDDGQAVDLFFEGKIIVSMTELDALWYNRSKLELAQEISHKITVDIPKYKKSRSLLSYLKKFGLALLVILIQILLIRLIRILFIGRINKFIWNKRGVWFRGIKIRNYEILNQNRQTTAILFIVKIIRYFIVVVMLYASLTILFSIFPMTERIARLMFEYVMTPLKRIGNSVLAYIPKLITIAVIVVITTYVVRLVKFLSREVEEERLKLPGFYPDWAKPTFNILKVLIYAFSFIVIFPYLPGSDSAVFKGVSVFLGIVFSLGSTSIIGNMVAGLVITYMRPFKIGDWIKVGDVVGNIVEKTAFVTRIRTPKKEFITIPNSNILSNNVINYSSSKQQGGLIVHTTVTIGYDVPWRKVHQQLTNAAKKTSHLNLEIAPYVLQTSLDDFYVAYQINAHTNEPDKQPLIYSELHQNIQDCFNEAGIEILSPHYRAARDGNQSGIPVEYLPKDYQAPGFKIESEKKDD